MRKPIVGVMPLWDDEKEGFCNGYDEIMEWRQGTVSVNIHTGYPKF